MSAPNPWDESNLLVADGQNISVADILTLVREMLLDWPSMNGQNSVRIDLRLRHERLVRIIAGYPEIESNRVPLDWPLNPKSIRSFKVSLLLDSIRSPDGTTSLRSALLNKSRSMRGLDDDKFVSAHKRLLTLLFNGIRIERGQDNPNGFLADETKLLIALHSTDNNEMSNYWPWNEMKVLSIANCNHYKIRKGQLESGWCEGWLDGSKDLEFNLLESEKIYSVKIQKIQSWIKQWSQNKFSIGGKIIRGASAFLENMMSHLRHVIIKSHGVSSIIIDGGGRIVFIGNEKSGALINDSLTGMFSISNNNVPFFNNELLQLVRIWNPKGKIRSQDFALFASSISSECLPPYSVIQLVKDDFFDIDKSKNITDYEPRGLQTGCPLCESEDIGDRSWNSEIMDKDSKICLMHRLLYFIGSTQRKLDSTTRPNGIGYSFDLRNRKLLRFCAIDLNSLGALFTSNRDIEADYVSLNRRCFRFNAQWWNIIHKLLEDEKLEIDRIGAWIAAGDDILLAEYVGIDTENNLNKLLFKLSEDLTLLKDKEYGEFPLSFAGAICERRKKESIFTLYNRVKDQEHRCKDRWKTVQFENDQTHLLTKPNGEMKEFVKTEQIENEIFNQSSLWSTFS